MATHQRTWKRAEASVAAIFGCRRMPGSGSGHAARPDVDDGSDSTHPRLYLETKLRPSWAAWTLWESVRAKARKMGRYYQGGHKVPVVGLRRKFRRGCLLVVHQDDYPEVTVEWLAARPDDQLEAILAAVRLRREVTRGGEVAG